MKNDTVLLSRIQQLVNNNLILPQLNLSIIIGK